MRPRSNARGRAPTRARTARAGAAGIRRLPARRLPVPPGITPSATSVPTSAAAACIVVPSPPNTATTSAPVLTPYSARLFASPGPPVASTSAVQPAERSVRMIASTAARRVRAAAGLVISSARATLELPLPENVQADLIGRAHRGLGEPARPAGLDGGLDR